MSLPLGHVMLSVGYQCGIPAIFLSFRFPELLNVALLFLSLHCFLLYRQKEVFFIKKTKKKQPSSFCHNSVLAPQESHTCFGFWNGCGLDATSCGALVKM